MAEASSDFASDTALEVLLFSVLRERLGRPTLTVRVDGPITGAMLLDGLAQSYPAIGAYRGFVRLAVNQAYVDESATIQPGDEVALITPVSGG